MKGAEHSIVSIMTLERLERLAGKRLEQCRMGTRKEGERQRIDDDENVRRDLTRHERQ